jgi:nicotinamidase-related amidase
MPGKMLKKAEDKDMGWKEELKELPMLRPEFELDASKTVLLIVDMIYLDAHPDYGLGPAFKRYPEMGEYFFGRIRDLVIPNHRRLIDFFHQHGLKVIYLTLGCWMPDKSDVPFLMQRSKKYLGCPKDKVSQVLDEIKPGENDLVVHKTSSGAFNSVDLEHILRNLGVTSLVVTGVATQVCVDLTARDAADRGFKVIVVDDACASHNQSLHDAALLTFVMKFGRVLDTEEVCAELEKGLRASESFNVAVPEK